MSGEDRAAGTALAGRPAGEDERDAGVLAADGKTPLDRFHPAAGIWLLP
jgi:hypothetical protein